MSTRPVEPLNESALPNFAELVQVALERVPVFPLPERSAVVLPVPSLNPYAPTNPCAEANGLWPMKMMRRKTNESTKCGLDAFPPKLPFDPRVIQPRILRKAVKTDEPLFAKNQSRQAILYTTRRPSVRPLHAVARLDSDVRNAESAFHRSCPTFVGLCPTNRADRRKRLCVCQAQNCTR